MTLDNDPHFCDHRTLNAQSSKITAFCELKYDISSMIYQWSSCIPPNHSIPQVYTIATTYCYTCVNIMGLRYWHLAFMQECLKLPVTYWTQLHNDTAIRNMYIDFGLICIVVFLACLYLFIWIYLYTFCRIDPLQLSQSHDHFSF